MTLRVIPLLVFPLLVLISFNLFGQKPRLIVTTDIGQDPDDEQSMVRLLHYANEFEIEGIIANADINYEKELPVLKDFIIHEMIDAYAKIESNMQLHDPEYPTSTQLHSIVKRGCYGNGVRVPFSEYIGEGKDTEGSDWIIHVVDRKDNRPVDIAVWGGACDLAQALWKVKTTRSQQDTDEFIKKLRVYFIGKQDSSNDWIISNFSKMWLILALDRGGDNWESGYRGVFWGGDMSNTAKEWLHKNIIDLNPLAQMYPDKAFTGGENKNPNMAMKEGDSPSMLYFICNGLNTPEHPSWGGWGGRYVLERDQFYRDANDLYFDKQSGREITSPRATVFRWRGDFQNDFATRVRWATQTYEDGNHHPIVKVNGDVGKHTLVVKQKSGKSIRLDASGSTDLDGDALSYKWMVYPEAGTYEGSITVTGSDKKMATVKIPKNAKGKTVHVILCVKDNANLSLTSYKRIVIEVR